MTSLIRQVGFALLATALVVACGAPKNLSTRGDLDSLVFDPSAQNVAVLLGSDGGNLDGVPVDIRGLRTMFSDASAGFNFTIESEERNASVRSATQMIERAAAQVGDRGTLLIYYSGHGAAGSGCMAFTDNCVTFSAFASAIKRVRSTPIKRLLFFADSCFSGQLVTGNSAVITGGAAADGLQLSADDRLATENVTLSRAGDDWYTALATSMVGNYSAGSRDGSGSNRSSGFEKNIFEQALTVAASRPNQESEDLGQDGGAFTSSLRRVFNQMKSNGTSTTIRQFLDKTVQDTSRQHSHTPVYRAFPSDIVLNDTMTGASTSTPGAVTTVPAQAINAYVSQLTDGSGLVMGAVDPAIVSMTICNGDKALCSTGTRDDIVLTKATASPGNRIFFQTDKGITLTNGYIFTLQGKDAAGKSIVQRTIRIVQN